MTLNLQKSVFKVYAMFLSKSNEGLSSTLSVAMFTNDTKQQYAIVGFNQTSDITNQVELQQIR